MDEEGISTLKEKWNSSEVLFTLEALELVTPPSFVEVGSLQRTQSQNLKHSKMSVNKNIVECIKRAAKTNSQQVSDKRDRRLKDNVDFVFRNTSRERGVANG